MERTEHSGPVATCNANFTLRGRYWGVGWEETRLGGGKTIIYGEIIVLYDGMNGIKVSQKNSCKSLSVAQTQWGQSQLSLAFPLFILI